jgi:hypothetical protein
MLATVFQLIHGVTPFAVYVPITDRAHVGGCPGELVANPNSQILIGGQ